MTDGSNNTVEHRRTFLGVLATLSMTLAGCLGGDDGPQLNPDDFDDEGQYHVAEGVARTDLELVDIHRDDAGWIDITLGFDGDLEAHLENPDALELPTPIPPELRETLLAPPEVEEILTAYVEAVEAGDDGEGLRLTYQDGRCTGSTLLQQVRARWYLEELIEWPSILGEVNRLYTLEC